MVALPSMGSSILTQFSAPLSGFVPVLCSNILVGIMTFNVRFKGMGCYHSRDRTRPTWDRMEPGDPNWKASHAGGKKLMDPCQQPFFAWSLPVGEEPELGLEVWGSDSFQYGFVQIHSLPGLWVHHLLNEGVGPDEFIGTH